MTRDEVETEIRRLLATETSAIRLSNALFTPGGLFGQLFSNSDEKKRSSTHPCSMKPTGVYPNYNFRRLAGSKKTEKPVVLPVVGMVYIEQLIPTDTAS